MPQPEQNEILEWVEETQPDYDYHLGMYDPYGARGQEVEITREEYIALKRHLPAVRGYTAGDAAECVNELAKQIKSGESGSSISPDSQQVAAYLVEARALCSLCPEAVVSPGESFDAQLKVMQTQYDGL